MKIPKNFYQYSLSLIIFLILDYIWLAVIAKNFYSNQIGTLLKPEPNWLAAITFYLVFIFGLNHFVITPFADSKPKIKPFVNAFLFGAITYATYDLTNLATLKHWPISVTIIDILWGGIIATTTTTITQKFTSVKSH